VLQKVKEEATTIVEQEGLAGVKLKEQAGIPAASEAESSGATRGLTSGSAEPAAGHAL
jgi:hypothetical protein